MPLDTTETENGIMYSYLEPGRADVNSTYGQYTVNCDENIDDLP